MKAQILTVILVLDAVSLALAQSPAKNPLQRHYREGETLVYRMNAVNESWHYSVRAEGAVEKDASGKFFEEFRWTGFVSDGQPVAPTPQTDAFRQRLSLDPDVMASVPDLTKVNPKLIGPITDFMTVYTDLWLAVKTGQLTHAGDHFYMKAGTPASWADGSHVLVGLSSIDFDMTLKSLDTSAGTAVLVVRHVPPEQSQIPLPAPWMQAPVADTPNNWVELVQQPDGKFMGGVGKETFTVELTVSLADGKILSAHMENVVKTIARTCTDKALTQCDPPEPHQIVRTIDIALVQ